MKVSELQAYLINTRELAWVWPQHADHSSPMGPGALLSFVAPHAPYPCQASPAGLPSQNAPSARPEGLAPPYCIWACQLPPRSPRPIPLLTLNSLATMSLQFTSLCWSVLSPQMATPHPYSQAHLQPSRAPGSCHVCRSQEGEMEEEEKFFLAPPIKMRPSRSH